MNSDHCYVYMYYIDCHLSLRLREVLTDMITNPGSAGAVQATLAAACNGQILVNADFRCPVNRNGKKITKSI